MPHQKSLPNFFFGATEMTAHDRWLEPEDQPESPEESIELDEPQGDYGGDEETGDYRSDEYERIINQRY